MFRYCLVVSSPRSSTILFFLSVIEIVKKTFGVLLIVSRSSVLFEIENQTRWTGKNDLSHERARLFVAVGHDLDFFLVFLIFLHNERRKWIVYLLCAPVKFKEVSGGRKINRQISESYHEIKIWWRRCFPINLIFHNFMTTSSERVKCYSIILLSAYGWAAVYARREGGGEEDQRWFVTICVIEKQFLSLLHSKQ